MSESTVKNDDTLALLSKLQAIDLAKIENDKTVRAETLALARKLSASLEEPINRATDLAFRVSSFWFVLTAAYIS
jgi:hypothetical protein